MHPSTLTAAKHHHAYPTLPPSSPCAYQCPLIIGPTVLKALLVAAPIPWMVPNMPGLGLELLISKIEPGMAKVLAPTCRSNTRTMLIHKIVAVFGVANRER